MSNLIVEICAIDSVKPHSNADLLELCIIKGWQCVVPKGQYKEGDAITYIPVDAVLPVELSDKLGVTKYLHNGRVRCAKLRGEPSFGVIFNRENSSWPLGMDVASFYNITKYEPPIKNIGGDVETAHPLFPQYTTIENLRNFVDIFDPSEIVVITEKIHGTSCRVGIIEGIRMAGSHKIQRKQMNSKGEESLYWYPYQLPGISQCLTELSSKHNQVILFGEIYGSKIQSLHYGLENQIGFRVFDLFIDGKYVDFNYLDKICITYGILTVPYIGEGLYDLEHIKELSHGNTRLGATHLREGLVIKPMHERYHEKIGRVIFKYLNDDYLLSKGISDSTDY